MSVNTITIIGSSAGGPRILKEIFKELPVLNGAIVLIQHMPEFINIPFCESLDQLTDMKVKIAEDWESLNSGVVYIAPSGRHLLIHRNRQIRLVKGEKYHHVCPSIDVTMKSLTPQGGIRHIGIVLTGMGNDGAEGIKHIKNVGGITIAQDEETSIIYGMPKEARLTGCVDMILNPGQIREQLVNLMNLQ